jgi:DNA-directed RNA polymerase specialized sigma24 family protein
MQVKQLNIHEEEIFVKQLQQWEPLAWKQLATDYGSRLRQSIREALVAYQLDDARQGEIERQTWRTVVENIDGFAPQSNYRLLDWLQDLQAEYVSQLSAEFPFFRRRKRLCRQNSTLPSNQDTRREVFSALDLVLEELPHTEREIVLQHFVQRLDADQLAQQYDREFGEIEQTLIAAKQKLHDYLLASDLFMRAQYEPGGD